MVQIFDKYGVLKQPAVLGVTAWGSIIGSVTDQTDLITYLNSNYVPYTRTLTINGVSYDLSADRSWTISGPSWGSITGTLTDQTDLATALNTLQSQINLTKKHIINDTVGASITGVSTETLVKTYEIPINTLTPTGFIDFWLYTIRSAGASILHRTYIKINSTNNFGTSTLIAEGSTGGNFSPYLTNFFKFVLKSGLIRSSYPTSNSNVSLASLTQINATCDNTSGSVWIFVSITP